MIGCFAGRSTSPAFTTRRRCAASPQRRWSTRKCSSSGATYRSKRTSPAYRTYLTCHLFFPAAPIVYAKLIDRLATEKRHPAPSDRRSRRSANYQASPSGRHWRITFDVGCHQRGSRTIRADRAQVSSRFALAADTIGTKRRGTLRTLYHPGRNSPASRACIDRCRDLARPIARPFGLTKWIKRT